MNGGRHPTELVSFDFDPLATSVHAKQRLSDILNVVDLRSNERSERRRLHRWTVGNLKIEIGVRQPQTAEGDGTIVVTQTQRRLHTVVDKIERGLRERSRCLSFVEDLDFFDLLTHLDEQTVRMGNVEIEGDSLQNDSLVIQKMLF